MTKRFISAALISQLLIGVSFAATPGHTQNDIMSTLPMLVLFFLGFYFLILRPQQKRQKDHQSMVDSIKVGDEVAMSGGLIGKAVKISDAQMQIEIAEGMNVWVQRSSISKILPKGSLKSLKSGK